MIQVLIIEDDPMVAKFNGIYVNSIPGFALAGHAKSAEEGHIFLKHHHVDLILLDVYMGKMTGLDFLVHLRKENNPVDVIVITAANDKASVQTALRFGAVDYLIKPFDFERFEHALLQFKQKFQLMNKIDAVSQDEIDMFLLKPDQVKLATLELPKGMTPHTFTRIAKQFIEQEQATYSAGDLAEITGISQVSIRKYLNYMVKQHLLIVDVLYQETGRPLHQYRLNPEKATFFHSFITG